MTIDKSQSNYDIVVLAATPGGIAASIAAARLGKRVLLLERTGHIGGLPANGLGVTDTITPDATAGIFAEFIECIETHYRQTYGEGSPNHEACNRGLRFEPSVAENVFEQMLAEHSNITLKRNRQFDADGSHVTLDGSRLTSLTVINRKTGESETYHAGVFADATYEGDLAAAAGVPYRTGREGCDEFGEPFAGRLYMDWNDTQQLLEGSTGEADDSVQAYNYRVILTCDDPKQIAIEKPADYRRDDYVSIIEDVRTGRLTHGIARFVKPACMKPVPIPNDKWDANDHPKSLISTDLAEENKPYPDADWTWRDRYAQRLRDYTLGLMWFCQNDEELPQAFRDDAKRWGLPHDEFADNGHFPRQLYVREARRMVGEHTFTALDCMAPDDAVDPFGVLTGKRDPAPVDQRPPVHADSIAAAHYPMDSHACHKREPNQPEREGYFAAREVTRPYTVPYGVIVPTQVDGLLVPVACSASHVGFSTLRMEPCWMALGHAAGVAASVALDTDSQPRQIDIKKLQSTLIEQGAVLIYFADVPRSSEMFESAQHLGLLGVLPGYHARLDEPVDDAAIAEWKARLPGLKAEPGGDTSLTRGQFLKQLNVCDAPMN